MKKYLIPIVGICLVGQYWIDGLGGVALAIALFALFDWFGEMAEKKEVVHE